jgi:hydrogenase small subunit
MGKTIWESFKERGISRREFLKFATYLTGIMGLAPSMVPKVVEAMEKKEKPVVLWYHGLECTGCSESFIRSNAPYASDLLLNVISLEADDTLQASSGVLYEENGKMVRAAFNKHVHEIIKEYKGKYILAVEGGVPLGNDGRYCIVEGLPYKEVLEEAAKNSAAIIAVGTCSSWGGIQAAKPNPTNSVSIDGFTFGKPLIKVPGCPPIPEVIAGTILHIALFGIPPVDDQGRPKQFFGNRIHDTCYRRPFFNAGQFVEKPDDDAAKKGWCLYKIGCRGPTTYASCGNLRWFGGISYPIQSGAPCIGCADKNFWDNGPFFERLKGVVLPNVEVNADKVGAVAAGVTAAAIGVHAVAAGIRHFNNKGEGEE